MSNKAPRLAAGLPNLSASPARKLTATWWPYFISDRSSPKFKFVQARSPTEDTLNLLTSSLQCTETEHSPATATVATSEQAYMVVGIFRPVSGMRGFPEQNEVGVALEHRLAFSPKRKFYALIRERWGLQSYEIDETSICFGGWHCANADEEASRLRRFLGYVDKAIEKELKARDKDDQRAGYADGKALATITPAQLAHMKEIIWNLRRSTCSTSFREPPNPATLADPKYFEIIKEPMDLTTMKSKLLNTHYSSVSEYIRDFTLIVDNCYALHGRGHIISLDADKMRSSFNKQIECIPELVESVSLTKSKAGRTTEENESSRAVYSDSPEAETSERSHAAEETHVTDNEVTVTVPANEHRPKQTSSEPSRKRYRAEAEALVETSIEVIKKNLDMLATTEINRAEEIAALLNNTATPQNFQSMVSMYEHTIGAEDTRAKIVFAHALKEVTAALSAAQKERASMLKEISEALKAYNERE